MAALCAWLGASLIVLGDGSRGIAAGIGVATVGLAVIAWLSVGFFPALAIAVGGAAGALRNQLSEERRWGVMPAGSTPRLVLCVATGLVALWIAASVTLGPGVAARFAVLAAVGLTTGRILTSRENKVVIAAAGVLALAVAEGAGLGARSVWPYLAAAAVAIAATLVPDPKPDVT